MYLELQTRKHSGRAGKVERGLGLDHVVAVLVDEPENLPFMTAHSTVGIRCGATGERPIDPCPVEKSPD
jgi:hypothetical protein